LAARIDASAGGKPIHGASEEIMRALVLALTLVVSACAAFAQTADLTAGKAQAAEVCAACHGENGVSVSATIPNLAGQKSGYLANQLRAFKAGTRKNDIMNAIASQLEPKNIADLTAYFASLQGPIAGTALSEFLPNVAKTNVRFPADYKSTFTHYTTVNYPERPQVRHLYANEIAVKAAREGKPMPHGAVFLLEVHTPRLDDAKKPIKGADGNLVPDTLAFITAMEMQPGWGRDIPEMLRNGDWNYAVFNADRTPRKTANQAECLACHKPLPKDSYLFSLKALTDAAMKKK
jgi:cytochrome c553